MSRASDRRYSVGYFEDSRGRGLRSDPGKTKRGPLNRAALVAVSVLVLLGAWIVWGGITYLEVGKQYPWIWARLVGWAFLSLGAPLFLVGVLPGALGKQGPDYNARSDEAGDIPERASARDSLLGIVGRGLLGGFLYAAVWFAGVRWGNAVIVVSVVQKYFRGLLFAWAVGLVLAGVLSGFLGAVWKRN